MLFTNNAGSSLLQHIAQSYSDIESLQFAELIRDYFYRRKRKRYRFQEEVLRDLREERQIKSFLKSYDPFIDYYCFDEPIQTAKDGYFKSILNKAAKARTVNQVAFELWPLCLCLSLKSDKRMTLVNEFEPVKYPFIVLHVHNNSNEANRQNRFNLLPIIKVDRFFDINFSSRHWRFSLKY